jgi:DNA polymerase-3 subunit alpha
MGIKVLPPDVNESNVEYTPRGADIRFGLAAIRNVGEGVVNLIKAAREERGRFTSFGDFLSKVDGAVCNKKTIESLIKAGAFDSLGSTRKGLMAVHLTAIDSVSETKRAEAIGQFDLFGSASESGVVTIELDIPSEEWDKATLLNYEREMLGLYVSDHPLLGLEGVLRSNSDISISELADEENGSDRMVTIAGLITGVQRKVSRQGASWAIVTVEDLEGSIDALFFSNTYNQYAVGLIEDRVVKIRGRVDWRDENLRFTAMEMSAIDLANGPVGPFTLYANSAQLTPPVIERIKETFRTHPGKREVQLIVSDQGKTTTNKLSFQVTASPSLSADLKAILGPDCVRN